MKAKTIEINGDVYSFKNFEPFYNGKTSIYKLYGRPSSYKIDIFNYRNNKLDEIIGLTGNVFFFNIYGIIYDEEGKKYYTLITRSYNYIKEA